MKANQPTASVVAVLFAAAVGCGETSENVVGDTASKTPFQAAAEQARAVTQAAELAAEAAAQPVGEVKPADPEIQQAAYEPPFPDRLDLFQPPKEGIRVARQTTGDSAESVVLLGFANLDRQQVLLSIDQIVRPLATGEETAGVKVISISPPRAVLQRGRSRWTASIE